MAIFFNLETLEAEAGTDANKFLALLEYHYNKKLGTKYSKYKPSSKKLHGYSYLLNPLDFFKDNHTDILYRVQYIKLAARRDYHLYRLYNYSGLQLSYYPDIDIEVINHNPLLQVTKSEVLFKYEH